jgi:hypothetical protein
MAFCNSCGAPLTANSNSCSKCGAVVGSVPAPAAPPASPAPPAGGSALKVVLIVVGIIVIIGILAIATVTFIGVRIAKNTHVSQQGEHVKVETPFGSVETSKDPEQAARDLGVEIYPGAQVEPNGATSASFGGVHTVTANFQTPDSIDKVCSFYKSKYPHATSSTSTQNQCTIVSKDAKNVVTINVEASGSSTKFQIASVTK